MQGGRLIIAGSDRRGTIYGIYDLCQALGVSPWYFWADVPVKAKQELTLSQGYQKVSEGELCYTLGMQGIHDSGFETKDLEGKTEDQIRSAKIKLLEKNIAGQRAILNFISSKEQDKHKSFACFFIFPLDSRYVLYCAC